MWETRGSPDSLGEMQLLSREFEGWQCDRTNTTFAPRELPAWWGTRRQRLLLLFSHSVVSDPLWPHGLQDARLRCPSPSPRAYSNSCPLSRWCHPTISSCVIPCCSCLQSFPASGSFPMSWLFPSGGPSIGDSSVSVLPKNIWDSFPLGWTGVIS